MPIRTFDTIVEIDGDRRMIVQLPLDIPVGRHRIVAVLDEAAEANAGTPCLENWSFPVLTDARWPKAMPLSRDEMYDDDGR